MRSIICCLQLVAHIQVSHAGARWIPRRSAAAGSGRPRCAGKSQGFTVSFSQRLRCSAALVRRTQPQAYKPQDRLGSLT